MYCQENDRGKNKESKPVLENKGEGQNTGALHEIKRAIAISVVIVDDGSVQNNSSRMTTG